MNSFQRFAFALTTLLLHAALVDPAVSRTPPAPGRPLLADDFEGDLSAWETNDALAIAIVDSADPGHGGVLELNPGHSTLYAVIKGSESWPAYRIEGEVLFPTNEHNYLGFIYNFGQAMFPELAYVILFLPMVIPAALSRHSTTSRE